MPPWTSHGVLKSVAVMAAKRGRRHVQDEGANLPHRGRAQPEITNLAPSLLPASCLCYAASYFQSPALVFSSKHAEATGFSQRSGSGAEPIRRGSSSICSPRTRTRMHTVAGNSFLGQNTHFPSPPSHPTFLGKQQPTGI